MSQRTSISNKCCTFQLSIQRKLIYQAVFSIDNKNCDVTLTTGVKMLKNQLYITGINYILKHIKMQKKTTTNKQTF